MQTEARVGVVEGGGPAHKLVAHHQRPLQHHGSQIGAAYQLIAGGVAGAVSKTCTAPLARLTILFQDNPTRVDIFYEAINCQLMELDHRFSDSSMEMLRLASTLDPKNSYESFRSLDVHELVEEKPLLILFIDYSVYYLLSQFLPQQPRDHFLP